MDCAVFDIIALFDLCYTIQYIHNASNRYDLYISPPMEIKYICDIYNIWSSKYILVPFKYMSSIFQIYLYFKYNFTYI